MIELRTCLLADYATATVGLKPTVIGIFDLFLRAPGQDGPLPRHFLFAGLACASMDGGTHPITFRLRDADAAVVREVHSITTFSGSGLPGRGLTATVTLDVVDIVLPDGDYAWEISTNGVRLGDTAFSVVHLAALPVTPFLGAPWSPP